MDKILIYLHGFLSSPQSVKAQATSDYWQKHHSDIPIVCPQLPYYPLEAKNLLDEIAKQYKGKQFRFIGSSLGGFLSTYMMNTYGGKAVLINPAVAPHNVLVKYLGEHEHPYTNETFVLEPHHMDELQSLDSAVVDSPEDFWVLLQTEDETLDYRHAVQKYEKCKLTIEEGGDHAFQGYERFLPDIYRFLFA